MAFAPTSAGQRLTAGTLNSLLLLGVTAFSAECNTAQSIPNRATEAVGDAVIWDNPPKIDLLGAWASGAPTRFTCPVVGEWTLGGSIGYNASAGGSLREAIWFVNGVLALQGRGAGVVSTAIAATALTVGARQITVQLAVGDYVELVPFQNSGGALALATGSLRSYMTATYTGLT